MTKLFFASFLFLGFQTAYSMENCHVVDDIEEQRFRGEITEVSVNESFKGCPESLLINKSFVANLFRVEETDKGTKCSYRTVNLGIACYK